MIEGTLIGFDFGERRIGVAVGETTTRIASPLGAIDEPANEPRFRAIEDLVREWQPAGFVVGRPRHDDGSEHAVARLTEKFTRRLEARFALPVAFIDETLTSAVAADTLRASRTRAGRPSDLDAMAATLILQSFLDEMPREEAHRP